MITFPLLEKTRRIHKIFQEAAGQHIDFNDIAEVLKNVIQASVFIINYQGSIKGHALLEDFQCERTKEKSCFHEKYNNFLLKNNEIEVNLLQKPNCIFFESLPCLFAQKIILTISAVVNEWVLYFWYALKNPLKLTI